MVLIQETVTESEDSPERPVAGLRGSVEIVAWRVRGGQRALATGASRVSPPVGVFLCWGGGVEGPAERSSGGPGAAQSWRGRAPGATRGAGGRHVQRQVCSAPCRGQDGPVPDASGGL